MNHPHCLRCKSEKIESYGLRFFCLVCGFTFHRESLDEDDELRRRRENEARS